MTPNGLPIRPSLEILEDRCVPATFTVTKLADAVGVPGITLREAILQSNATPSVNDTIVFATGLQGVIKLNSQLDITDDVTINGPGSTLLKISGVGTTPIFKLDDGAGVHSMKVAIGKLTLLRGNAVYGGAIFNNNDDVDLRQCTLSDNVS